MTDTQNRQLDEKSKKTIADYVGDIVSLESHIEEAMDRQLDMAKGDANLLPMIQEFHDAVKQRKEAAKAYQEKIGTTAGNPIAAVGSNILGKAAGIIDKVRTEGKSKAVRDDYVAFNLAAISYNMLHVTALALGDTETENFAHEGLKTYARLVQQINRRIGEVVVGELKADGHKITDQNAAQENQQEIDQIWKSAAA